MLGPAGSGYRAPVTALQVEISAAAPNPSVPASVGALTAFTAEVLCDPTRMAPVQAWRAIDVADPLGDLDFQRSLYLLHDIHYRCYEGVSPDAEWHPNVVTWWHAIASRFETALRSEVPLLPANDGSVHPGATGDAIVASIDGFDGPSLSGWILEHASIEVLREFAIHRSAYQLKEADPHTFALPRLDGAAKAAFVEIQMDEYGNGEPGRAHAELFARSMVELGLDASYGHYLQNLPATSLATVNLMTHLALHRRLLPALLGHLALFEMTSVTPMGRYAQAMRRIGMPDAACEFYDVHVEADEHHGPLARRGLVDAYVAEHPGDAPLTVWGAQVTMAVERRFAAALIDAWSAGRSSLLR